MSSEYRDEPNEAAPETGNPPSVKPPGWRRRYLTRRNALLMAGAITVGLFLLVIIGILLYRTGQIDRLIARQIIGTLAQYNIRAEIGSFQTRFTPRTVEIRNLVLYDAVTGNKLGKADRLLATVRIEDLYALNLRRNINLEKLEIDGLEAWVQFDEQGRSNFRNIQIPPPDPNRRILFSYSTAEVKLNGAVIHYDDADHNLSGEARNLTAEIAPEDISAPTESRMNRVQLAFSDSKFVFDGRTLERISASARGRIDQTRAEIEELILRSPVAEARLTGTMDDWRALRYKFDATATVDLTQISETLRTETALRGAGKFTGTVSGEGTRYQVNGRVESDALAADGVRLQGLDVSAQGSGDGASYEANGRAVAALLNAGDFRLDAIQLGGKVRGTGTDFRWVGELRAAAARSGAATITGLIISDVVAEAQDAKLTATARRATAGGLNAAGTRVDGISAANIRVDASGETTTVTVPSASASSVTAAGALIKDVTVGGIKSETRGETTNVALEKVALGELSAAGARTGSINIAGVRLAVQGGRVTGSSGDINVGTVTYANEGTEGRIEDVRVARPVFTVEPQGRYRASADLSLGGGVLGQMKLGAARSQLVATNDQIQLIDFRAEVADGRAEGNATISTARNGTTRITASFVGINFADALATFSGRVATVAGKATGSIDLALPDNDINQARGQVRAEFSGETSDANGRIPLTGDLALRAERGSFNIETAHLRTGASELTAKGQFSFASESNLTFNLASSNASELKRVLVSSGLAPGVEERLDEYGVDLAGKLSFDGALRGSLQEPRLNGRLVLDSLVIHERDLGALVASIETDPDAVRIADGQLTERDGGGARFSVTAPLKGTNNISIDATLDRVNAGALIAALPPELKGAFGGQAVDLRSDLSGKIGLDGLPGAVNGRADLRFGPGSINGEPFREILARAAFNDSVVKLETLDAQLDAGRVTASGSFSIKEPQAFNLQARAENIQLDRLRSLMGSAAIPPLAGTADLVASVSGDDFKRFSTYRITINGEGRNVTVKGRPAGALVLAGRTENNIFDLKLTTGLLGQPQIIAARINLGARELPAEIETTLAGADLTPLFAAFAPQANVRIMGRATGRLAARGNLIDEDENFSLAGLSGTANFSELSFQVEDVRLDAATPLVVQFSPRQITFERTRFTGPGSNVELGGTLALAEGGTQNLSVNGDLNLSVLKGISPDLFLSGGARFNVTVRGTYADPLVNGTATVSGATVATLIGSERLSISNIRGVVRFNARQAAIESLTGNLGGGRVSVAGAAALDGFPPSQFRLTVRGDDITAPLPAGFNTTADADLTISGSARAQVIDGVVNLRRAEYTENIELADLINQRREAPLTAATGGGGFAAQLNLRVEGRDALVVRNNLADVIGSVSLRINGTTEDPLVSGRITATRGTVNFRNDRYDLVRALIDLPPRRDADPILNVQAESEISGYRVIVALTGALSELQASVRSEPALPQADVVSLITTGTLASGTTSASTLAQTGVGTAASLLTDTLINAPAQRATEKLFGLNRFEIDPLLGGRSGTSPTARLTVGRQINRNLLVTYSTNFTSDQNQVVAVEYRVSDRLSFVAQYEQGSAANLRSSNNNIFSFEIRFRRRF
jgi:translocation and assembly module TamB